MLRVCPGEISVVVSANYNGINVVFMDRGCDLIKRIIEFSISMMISISWHIDTKQNNFVRLDVNNDSTQP